MIDESQTFRREAQRIRFRQDLMSLPGGVGWLVRMGRLFGFTCRALAPGAWGLPDKLRQGLYRLGW